MDGRRHIYWKSGDFLSSDRLSDESLLREAIIKKTDRSSRDFSRHRQTKSSKSFMCFCIQCQSTLTGAIRLARLLDVCRIDTRSALCVHDSFKRL